MRVVIDCFVYRPDLAHQDSFNSATTTKRHSRSSNQLQCEHHLCLKAVEGWLEPGRCFFHRCAARSIILVNMTIEEQIQQRNSTIQFVFQLTEELSKSIQFFLDKLAFTVRNEMADANSITLLLEALKAETWNTIEKVKMAQKMAENSLLPISKRTPSAEMREVIAKACTINFAHPNDQQTHQTFRNLANGLFQELFHLENSYVHFDNPTLDTFEKLKNQYKEENKSRLECYIEDIASAGEAKVVLRKDCKGMVAVECWNNNGRDVIKTFKELRERRVEEIELIPLFDYIAKYEMLQTLPKEPNVTSYHFHDNSQNIEKIDNHIIQK